MIPSDQITGAEALIRSLIAEGTDTVFGYPGGAIMPVYDTLYDYQNKLTHILVRHEQGASHAAEGYARVTGRPGVVIVTSGPGATNILTGLSDALMDSTPMVVITGQVASGMLGSEAFQETDMVAITLPITKWATQIRKAEDIPAMVARAFYIATSGRPGPVVLDIAKDAQIGFMNWKPYQKCSYIRSYNPTPALDIEKIETAAEILNEAQCPLILAGHGVTISDAGEQLKAIAEKLHAPVACTLLGLSAMPTDHPLYKGMLGMHGNLGPNHLTNYADVILGVGLRFDDRVTSLVNKYAPKARIIHVDIDPSENGKIVSPACFIQGDARDVLEQITEHINPANHDEWLKEFDKCEKDEAELIINNDIHPLEGCIKMGEAINYISTVTKNEAIVVTDVGQNQMFAARYSGFSKSRSMVTSGGLGTMGFGLPAAIGASLGCPDRTVILYVGDGGLQMTIQELGTIMQYGINVKIVLLNNNFLGNVRQWQAMFFNNRFSQTPMINPDFIKILEAYDIPAENVASREELPGAVERMLAAPTSYLININIDSTDMIFPMIAPGQGIDEILIA
ncbi:MAG: biosynthetic-type acetolactate synthase large subunit, partial [Muribaculaceae bacterium]|nr:biosynthetic-type acetolactate synthase large subunit [Muribaculaceae bacterium]